MWRSGTLALSERLADPDAQICFGRALGCAEQGSPLARPTTLMAETDHRADAVRLLVEGSRIIEVAKTIEHLDTDARAFPDRIKRAGAGFQPHTVASVSTGFHITLSKPAQAPAIIQIPLIGPVQPQSISLPGPQIAAIVKPQSARPDALPALLELPEPFSLQRVGLPETAPGLFGIDDSAQAMGPSRAC
jgi:hypothetical protein